MDRGDLNKLLSTPVFDVQSGTVIAGRREQPKLFYRLDFPAWVNIIALTTRQHLVLIRQPRFGSGRLEVEIPGGAVEEGESPLEAGLRELLEETGYGGANARVIGRVCPNPALQDNFCYTVLVENAVQVAEQHLDESEEIEVFTVPVEEVFEMVKRGDIAHGLVLNALFYFALHQRPNFLAPEPG
jgi:8-oxo-dGTP pyrophosphatase MutT (NUDIX family)